MQVSLMTLDMFIRLAYHYFQDHDMEEFRELYEEMMEMTADAGIQTVEVTSRETRFLGVDYVKEVLERCRLSVGGYMHMDTPGEDPIFLDEALSFAKKLGADTLMLIPQWHDSLAGCGRREIHELYAKRWSKVAADAYETGIRVVVEDTPNQALHLCSAEDVLAFLPLLPHAELVYDSGNMLLAGEDPVDYIKKTAARIGYVHLKDMREIPMNTRGGDLSRDGKKLTSAKHGTGLVPLDQVIQELQQLHYNGRWVIELSMDGSESYPEAIRAAQAYLREYIGTDDVNTDIFEPDTGKK